MKLLDAEVKATGKVKADVVFVTEDECWTTGAFLDEYLTLIVATFDRVILSSAADHLCGSHSHPPQRPRRRPAEAQATRPLNGCRPTGPTEASTRPTPQVVERRVV